MPRGRPRKVTMEQPTTATEPVNATAETPIPEPGQELPVDERPSLAAAIASSSEKKWKRGADGLLENYDYIYNEDGSINWLAMVPQEFFVAKGRKGEQDVSKLEDKDKLILRAGWQKIAAIRGYRKVKSYFAPYSSAENIALHTVITWVPNEETDGEERETEGFGDAHFGNVNNKPAANGYVGTNFLLTTAENRAFARAVRKELQIPVLSQDEITAGGEEAVAHSGTPAEPDDNKEARKNLQKVLEGANLSFENFKNAMTKHVADGRIKDIDVQNWESINDIASEKLFEVTNFLQQRLRAKATQS